jgi:hypothetical protein
VISPLAIEFLTGSNPGGCTRVVPIGVGGRKKFSPEFPKKNLLIAVGF